MCIRDSHGGDHQIVRPDDRQADGGAGDADDPGGAVLPAAPLLQKQHHEQSRQRKVHPGGVKGQEIPQESPQGRGHHPIAVIQQRDTQIEIAALHLQMCIRDRCTGAAVLEDFKGRSLIAFGGEWSVGFLTKHNPGLELAESLSV